ncbi:uncharacterized protein LOC114804301 [Zeugodacus cucurbitae]|uniref:uncharacterized protein LOC114804301 n=1 Tax=Zeugodacus cucurbitae TaxID=28588 RepID=UPI0023D8F14F|nr:uncharacterized protein LOC114804301 [Zeugodacus cucurbitae]XP_054082718.1 uncharacterized protein LOC114804301 [Zeugodacus cucurbitae]
MLSCMQRGMDPDTLYCSPDPLFDEITEVFLDTFGTNTIPAGYVKGDSYGPKTNRQDFAKLFRVFYILIILAVLCVLVLIMMIIFLVWYYKRRNYEAKSCSKIKFWSLFIIILLLLSLILSAFGLYMAFANISDLRKIYTKPEVVSNEDVINEDKFDNIEDAVSKILVKDFEKLKTNSISSCGNSNSLKDLYSATTKLRKISSEKYKKFSNYIDDHIITSFAYMLRHEDVYRMFARNFSAYMSVEEEGRKIVLDNNITLFDDYIFALSDWWVLHNISLTITKLMPYYAITAKSDLRKIRVCMHIEDYFDEISVSVNQQRNFINEKFESIFETTTRDHKAPYKFGYIICIIATVVLIFFLIFLLCSLCLKFKTMVKPLIFIYIMLTLVFILMAFVTFYHFFYGVIEYNGLCEYNARKANVDSFRRRMLQACTSNQNVYTLLAENHWINGLSEWNTIDDSEIYDDCIDTCTPLERLFLFKLDESVREYPKECFCQYKGIDKKWLKNIESKYKEYAKTMTDFPSTETYYSDRIRKTSCVLDLAKQMDTPFTKKIYKSCTSAFDIGTEFAETFRTALDEVNDMCQTTIDSCSAYIRELNDLVQNITDFKIKSEDQLKLQFGTCDDMFRTSRIKQEKYCNCDIYTLNGVWVGSLIFLLGTLLALLLLPCLLYLFVKCSGKDRLLSSTSREVRDREGDDSLGRDSAYSILLPAITLPKHVINSIRDDPRVRYKVKKIN